MARFKKSKNYSLFIFPINNSVGMSVLSDNMVVIHTNCVDIKSLSSKNFIEYVLNDIDGLCMVYDIKDVIVYDSFSMFEKKFYDIRSLILAIQNMCENKNFRFNISMPYKIFEMNCSNHIDIYYECINKLGKQNLIKRIIPGIKKGIYYSLLLGYYYLNEQ